MAIKTLEVTLNPLALAAGWYQDPATGQWYYYDEEGNRYIYVAGYIYPMHVFEPAPKVVNLAHGDTLRINFSFKYSGAQKTVKPYGCVGQKNWPSTFDEILKVTGPSFTLSQSTTPLTYNRSIDIPITTAIAAGKHYSIYVKLINGISMKEGETGSVALENAVYIVSAEPTFAEFKITDYVKV